MNNFLDNCLYVLCIAGIICFLGVFICILAFMPEYPRACVEAKIYNERFHTNYNKWDFFWAGKTIREYLNGGQQETKNYNINGAIPIKLQD